MSAARGVRTTALVALLLLAVPTAASPTGPAADGPAMAPSMLTLEPGQQGDFVTPSIDVSAALTIGHERGAERIRRETLVARLDEASNETAKQRILFLAATDIKRSATTLREHECASRLAYRNGSSTVDDYARRLAINAARGQQLRLSIRTIGRLAETVPEITIRDRILETRLIGLDGPVRERIRSTLDGSGAGSRIHVMASRNGTVLATFDDRGRYLREAYRGDRWTRNTVGETTLPGIVGRIRDTYPMAYNRSTSTSFTGGLGRGIYAATLQLSSGTLEAHLDADTGKVFYEVRAGSPESMASDSVSTARTDTLRLVVNRSVPGGPLRIATIDSESGTPVDRPVVVDGRALRTGPDGVLWTLTPDDPQFSIRVATDDGPVAVTVRPLPSDPNGTDEPGGDDGAVPTT